jgi:Flagellar biosynthesis protein, FliO
MNFKIRIERSSNQKHPEKRVREPGSMHCASSAKQISASFAQHLGDLGFSAIKKQKLTEISRPKSSHAAEEQGSLLRRAFSWLNENRSAPKRLRVLETVTLGDKRLVAVIQAEGRRFLVGGGPSGVSLLTALDQMQKPLVDLESSAGLRELAG